MSKAALPLMALLWVSSAVAAPKYDRIKVYDAELRRCVRYYLSEERMGRALAALNIHPEDLCRCSTPIFVSGLSDDDVTAINSGSAGFTPAIINRFVAAGRVCAERLSP